MELLTSSELVEKQKAGFINVIIANGGTEARGPHNILAGHTIMSKHTAIDAAKIIGNTLVAPVMPIDVGATGVSDGSNIPGGITCRARSSRASSSPRSKARCGTASRTSS